KMSLGLDLMTANMHVDFLLAEVEGDPTLAERFQVHAQDSCIEVFARVDVAGGQYQVVQMVNHKTPSFGLDTNCWLRVRTCSGIGCRSRRLPALRIWLGVSWPIRTGNLADACNTRSRSSPVSYPMSSSMCTRSSVQTFPLAPGA